MDPKLPQITTFLFTSDYQPAAALQMARTIETREEIAVTSMYRTEKKEIDEPEYRFLNRLLHC